MSKILCWALFVLLTTEAFSQRERIHIDLNRYSCMAGDTIFLKGVVLKGRHPTTFSTNLYIELYTESGILLQRSVFPILRGQSVGQVILPDTLPTANYYLVALTRQQLNYNTQDFFSVPVLVYNRERTAIVNHKQSIPDPASATAGTIKGITWISSFYQGKISSLLEIDSGSHPRHLRLINPIKNDSILAAEISLDNTLPQKYSLFPADTTHDKSILLLFEDSVLIGRQVIHTTDQRHSIRLTTDTLNTSSFGYNSWQLHLPGPAAWLTSIDVTDADRSSPSPAPIDRLNDSYTDDFTIRDSLADTGYVSYTGKATREFGKRLKDPFSQQIVVAGVQDSNYIFTRVVNIDASGNFKLDSLFFFGDIGLHFQVNKEEDGHTRDIKLGLDSIIPPVVDSFAFLRKWEDDTVFIGKADTTYTPSELQQYEVAKFKTLRAVIVHGWKNPRKELDEQYATGPFAEPALFTYDLREDSSAYDRDIFWYISAQNGRLHYDPRYDMLTDVLNHPIHYFVDEVEYSPDFLRAFDFDRLAYIKILESDFLSNQNLFTLTPISTKQPLKIPDQKTAVNVCIYTRKGNDFRTMRGGMNRTAIKGFTEVLPFHGDKVTLYWHPLESGHSFNIQFTNAETTKRFRVKVEGISSTGEIIHYETVLPN